jgi:hypothetical protein
LIVTVSSLWPGVTSSPIKYQLRNPAIENAASSASEGVGGVARGPATSVLHAVIANPKTTKNFEARVMVEIVTFLFLKTGAQSGVSAPVSALTLLS